MRSGCKTCADIAQRKSHEQFVQEVYDRVLDDYIVLGHYEGVFEKVQMKHNICGYIWDAIPHKFINHGRRCPKCNESKGEASIRRYLEYNEIDFGTQYRTNDCFDEKPLPFDFIIYENGELSMLIEFDGIQHFEPVEKFGGLEAHLLTKKHDNIKNEFCKSNDIKLVRIPYWEIDNIDIIIEEELGLPVKMDINRK